MDYYGKHIPNHIRITQPHGERRHAGPADKAVLEKMRRRNSSGNSAEKPPQHCSIITVIEHSGGSSTRYCLTHKRTFLSGDIPERCPAVREAQGAAL